MPVKPINTAFLRTEIYNSWCKMQPFLSAIMTNDIQQLLYVFPYLLISFRLIDVMIYIQAPVYLDHHGHHSLVLLIERCGNDAAGKGPVDRHGVSTAFEVAIKQSLYFFRGMIRISADADVRRGREIPSLFGRNVG